MTMKQRNQLMLGIFSGAFSLLGLASTARAATYTVNIDDAGYDGACTPTHCSLIDAILEANATPGHDTIQFDWGYDILFDESYENSTTNATPIITDNLTILAEGGTLSRDEYSDKFRFFQTENGASLTIEDMVMLNGDATNGGNGGAIQAGGPLTLRRSVAANCSAPWYGGAIYAAPVLSRQTPVVRLEDTTLRDNSAGYGGGGINVFTTLGGVSIARVIIEDTAIVRNMVTHSSAGVGGGLNLFGNIFSTVTNSTFGKNFAWKGGGVSIWGVGSQYWTRFTNVTLMANAASAGGAGVYKNPCVGAICDEALSVQPEIRNSIFINNNVFGSVPSGAENCEGQLVSGGNNVIYGELTQAGNCAPAGQLFASTSDIVVPSTNGLGDLYLGSGYFGGQEHYPILSGTFAGVDAANPFVCTPDDQLDVTRFGVCDIGAVEYIP